MRRVGPALAVCLVASAAAHAQPAGVPSDARAFGMGGVSAALFVDSGARGSNPAGLRGLERPWASIGLQRVAESGTAYPSFEGEEARFSDAFTRPAFVGYARPFGRVVLQASWISFARIQSHVSFAGQDASESGRAVASVSELGLSASFRAARRLTLGASLGRTQFSSDYDYSLSRVFELRSSGRTPYVYTNRQLGKDARASLALGVLIGQPQSRLAFGFVWRRAQTFRIPYSSNESFPSLGLSYSGPSDGKMPSDPGFLAGTSLRLGRLRLGLDLGYGGEPLYGIAAVCLLRQPPAPQEICARGYEGPRSPPLGGGTARVGAELALPLRIPVFLRAGLQGDEYSSHATFGAGALFASRLQVDLAGGVAEGGWRGLLTLSLRL